MATNTSKSLTRRTIFLLAAAILYLMIPQNAVMPMPEEAVFPMSLLSLAGIARVFSFRQWIAMDLILFAAVLVIMQLIREKHEGMLIKNRTVRIICLIAFFIVFLPLAYIIIPTVFIPGKPSLMSMDAWVFLFGKQGGANQYILHLWWAVSAVLLDLGITK